MTLLEAIALAGGTAISGNQVTLQDLADLRHSFVMRQGQLVPVGFYRLLHEGDTSQNIYLQPDDFVYVPSALSQQVYVLGAVRAPRSVPYTDGMTLVSAMTSAAGAMTVDWFVVGMYGVQPDAYLSHVAIVRGSLSEPKMIVADYGAIIKGGTRDVALEPGDIIYVPNAPYSTLKRYLNTIVNTFVSTIAANEGSRGVAEQRGRFCVGRTIGRPSQSQTQQANGQRDPGLTTCEGHTGGKGANFVFAANWAPGPWCRPANTLRPIRRTRWSWPIRPCSKRCFRNSPSRRKPVFSRSRPPQHSGCRTSCDPVQFQALKAKGQQRDDRFPGESLPLELPVQANAEGSLEALRIGETQAHVADELAAVLDLMPR